MKYFNILFSAMIALCSPAIQASGANVDIIINVPPPAPRIEVVPPPRVGYIWIDGYWGWDGYRHVWVPGRWLKERPGYAWIREHWERRGDRYYFISGRWERGHEYHARKHDRYEHDREYHHGERH